jgi:hypothetical protein
VEDIDMSIKVKLEDGEMEKFHRSYIVESLEAVGLDHHNAKEISKTIGKRDGMTEHDIKVKVYQKLDEIDSEIAERYLKTKKVRVKIESMQVMGHVMVPEFLMTFLELKHGDKIDIIHGEENQVLRVSGLHIDEEHNVILLSERDMKKLNVKEKGQVAICKHHE